MKPGDRGVLSNRVQLLLQGYSKPNEVQRFFTPGSPREQLRNKEIHSYDFIYRKPTTKLTLRLPE